MQDISVHRGFLADSVSPHIFAALLKCVDWQRTLRVAGTDQTKSIRRSMAYVSDEPVIYRYANLEVQGGVWVPDLTFVRDDLIKFLGRPFNSCLLNLYEDGRDEIRWHSDKEKQLGPEPVIACVNLGATRNFWFLEKATGLKTAYEVGNGDLLVMWERCQQNYLHAILKEPAVKTPRISLTFRQVKE